MKKIRMTIFAVLALLAFSALTAVAASAETTLLAEWLLNSGAVTQLTSTETKGTLLLEDEETIGGKAAVECTATADGSVGPNGEDETTEILNALGEPVTSLAASPNLPLLGEGNATGLGSECKTEKVCAAGSSVSPIEVWPIGLPWLTSLFLMENGTFLNLIYSEVLSLPETGVEGLFVGYELLCLILGINAEDTCYAEDFEFEVVNDPTTGDAAIPAGALASPNATCSQSGLKPTGVNQAVNTALILPLAGVGLLTVSSE